MFKKDFPHLNNARQIYFPKLASLSLTVHGKFALRTLFGSTYEKNDCPNFSFCYFCLFDFAHTPGLSIDNFISALLFTALSAFLIFLIWPLMLRFLERFIIITFGIGSFLVSTFILWLGSLLIPGVSISGWGWLLAPFEVAIISALVTVILSIDDDEVFTRSVYAHLRRRLEKAESRNEQKKPGFVFIEIDGLSEAVLKLAIDKGKMPFVAELIEKGSHKIKEWETDLSSQTGSSQAGILHGCNKDIPAFRWVDKSINKIVSSNGIGDAPIVQSRISDGKGLLSVNGGAVANLFTGDSKDTILVYSVVKNIKQLYSESWGAFYTRPYNFARVIVLTFVDLILELRSRYRQWRRNIEPRLHHRGLKYFIARAGANIILREISTYILIGDIIAGDKDAVYTTYFGYDEIAHHCGITDDESLYSLQKLDHRISRIFAAQKYGKRHYEICILSDHGQTNGATFKQRYGLSLDQLVKRLLPEKENVYHDLDSNQDHFGQMITAPGEAVNRKLNPRFKEKKKVAEAIVLASGNLGLIYFTKWSQRLTLEDINLVYPEMIPGLINHEGIGFIMLDSGKDGPVVINSKGSYHLSSDKLEGENPLNKFGEHAAFHLLRTSGFKYLPDILVMSQYDSQRNEVAAFEELIGSHGGLGGFQSKPFIVYPADWHLENEEIVGAENIYRAFKRVMKDKQPL
jgi:uncharacterized membrane protein YvlD (DUF360 family)